MNFMWKNYVHFKMKSIEVVFMARYGYIYFHLKYISPELFFF